MFLLNRKRRKQEWNLAVKHDGKKGNHEGRRPTKGGEEETSEGLPRGK